MFARMNKKFLIVTAFILVLLIGALFYWYFISNPYVENQIMGNNEGQYENSTQQQQDITNEPNQNNPIKPETNIGGLTVCADKCGDGICQNDKNYVCKEGGLNCTCIENNLECPQDCSIK